MGKNKSKKQNASQEAKQQLHGIKGGSIKKNKDLKFKNTPMSKAALINHLKAQDKNVPSQKNAQKVAKNQNQNLPKQAFRNNAKQLKQDSPNGKQKSPNKAQNQKRFILNPKNKLENVDDSSSDDEGITSQEDVSLNKTDETFEDEDDSDTDVPDILGKSLGDETDEDDEDFEDEQEEEEDEEDDDDSDEGETIEHKGLKMFKGLEFKAKKNDDEQKNDSDDDDDESDESMEFGENDEDNEDDDDDDEEDEDDDEDEEDEDDDNNDRKQTKNIKESIGEIDTSLMETDEDEDDDDEDDDEDDYDDDAKMGLKALVGKSILDDDDDEDFNEEDEDDEDDDISSEDEDDEENYNATATKAVTKEKVLNKKNVSKETQMEKKKKKVNPEEQEQLEKKTIIIDNLPKGTIKEELNNLFNQFGIIKRIRLGSFLDMVSKIESPEKKAAARTRQMHPKLTTLVGNILYTTEKSALAAVKARNGAVFEENYLNVQTVARSKEKHDEEKSVFLANLKWGIGDNEIWKIFRKCGEIERVYLRRDMKTGQGMGFGHVNFYTKDAAALALKLDGVEIMGRPIKVLPFWNYEQRQAAEKKNKKHGTKRTLSHKNDKPSKKFKNSSEESVASNFEYERNIKKHKKQQGTQNSEEKSTAFQGQKVDLKNKKKNKLDKKKKKMAEKLTAKSAKV